MSFRLLKTSALSGVPPLYTIDGRDYVHVSVGVGVGSPAGLSSVKATFDQVTESVYSNKRDSIYSVGWLSAGATTDRKMISRGGSVIIMDGVVDATHAALSSISAPAERLTVQGNISASGSLSAAGGGYNYFANNVGIGTTAPSFGLHVNNNSNGLFLESTGNPIIRHSNGLVFEDSDGTDRVYFANGGNVGIGTNAPSDVLEVNAGTSNGGLTVRSSTDNAWVTIDAPADEAAILNIQEAGTTKWQIYRELNDSNLTFYDNAAGSPAMTIKSNSGSVGIGTIAPEAKLSVVQNNTSQSSIQIRQDGTGDANLWFSLGATTLFSIGVDNSDADKFKIASGHELETSTRLTIDTSGNVGIGTTDPEAKLSVVGSISATGDIALNDGGSITEGDGLAAITFDGSGHVTKIGQSTETTDHFLKFDGSKAVWSNDTSVVFNALYFSSDRTTAAGPPIVCASTERCVNLNADLWDGAQFSTYIDQGVRTTDSVLFKQLTINNATAGQDEYLYLGDGAGTSSTEAGIRRIDGTVQVKHTKAAEDQSLYDGGTGNIGWGTVLNAGFAAHCYGKVKLTGGKDVRGPAAAGCTIERSGAGQFEVTPDRRMSSHTCVFAQGDYDFFKMQGTLYNNRMFVSPANTGNAANFKIACQVPNIVLGNYSDDLSLAWYSSGLDLFTDTGLHIQFVAFDPATNVKQGANGEDEVGGRWRSSTRYGDLPDGTASDDGFS